MNAMAELAASPVRTLIVDDAPLMRKAIRQILTKNNDVEIIGTAANGQECLERIAELQPDVVTLDIDMPVMNGITAIKNIMVRHQVPIVIVSSLIQDGYFAFEALRLGVVDFIPKPSRAAAGNWAEEEELLRMRVRMAATMHVNRMRRVRKRRRSIVSAPHEPSAPRALVVMGTTLAGPNTLMHIVTQLPPDFQGTIIAVQEIHPRILGPFCSRFNEISPLEVIPATGVCPVLPGKVYLTSIFKAVRIERDPAGSGGLILNTTDQDESPIDQLFESAAAQGGADICGVLLTGIGTDGAAGMQRIKEAGGLTIAQEQDCSVYPNLVEHALQRGVVDLVMTHRGIADRLSTWARDGEAVKR